MQQLVDLTSCRVEVMDGTLDFLLGPLHVRQRPLYPALAIKDLSAIGVGNGVRVNEGIALLNQRGESIAAGMKFIARHRVIGGTGVAHDGFEHPSYLTGWHGTAAAVTVNEARLELLDQIDHRPLVVGEDVNRPTEERGVIWIVGNATSHSLSQNWLVLALEAFPRPRNGFR